MLLHGKALISWAIDSAINSGFFDRIILSTDSEEYAQIAEERGVEVPFLRKFGFDDYSPVSIATANAAMQSSSYFDENYDIVVQLMATCPLRKAQTIRQFVVDFESNVD